MGASLQTLPMSHIEECLAEIADCISTPRANLWKLKNEKDCHPFVITLHVGLAMNHLSHYRQRFPDVLCPFPPLRPEVEDVLASPVLMSLMFLTLLDFADIDGLKSWETIHIIFNFLLILAGRNLDHTKLEVPEVAARFAADLRSFFAGRPFSEQVWTPIRVQERPARSIVNLLEASGPLGVSTLVAMNIGFTVHTAEKAVNPRDRARLLREKISQDFSIRQASFGDLSGLDSDGEGCNVCNLPVDPDDTFCYPAVSFISSFSQRWDPVCCFRLCSHLVHEKCIHFPENGPFRCPVDRLARTLLVPNLQKIGYAKPSRKIIILLRNFRVAITTVTQTLYDVELVISSLCHSLRIYEIQMRNHTNGPEAEIHFLLFRNLFLVLWHWHHAFGLSFERDHSDPLRRLLGFAIESDDPLSISHSEAKRLASHLDPTERFLFLRLATIFISYSLGSGRESIDLTAPVLSEHFALQFDPVLPASQFAFVNLPRRFIDLSQPPFNIDIENQSSERVLCLLTGTVVSMDRIDGTYAQLSKHLHMKCPSHASFLLTVSGPNATRVYVAATQMNCIKIVPGIYLDAHGDEDVGFLRGKMTYLNEQRLRKYEDMLLSGEWTDFDNSP
jgi:hypothetical protein